VAAVKRYQVYHAARTTGAQMLRAMSDAPADAHTAARSLEQSGERGVEIVDSSTGKAYGIQAFAAEHKLR
jgi:hypothetical protein